MNFRSDGLARLVGGRSLTLQANSPKILLGLGLVGFGATVVAASMATLKVEDVIEKGQADLKKVNDQPESEEYTEKDRSRDKAIIYTRTAMGVVKLYAPAILFGSASVLALTKSYSIQSQRITALTAAYHVIDQAFNQYRERVVERYGEEVDREMRYGMEKVSFTDPETGKKSTVKRVSNEEPSMYSRFFDPKSRNWSKDVESNYVFIRAQQRYLNNLLIARGHLFLNEVYDALDIPRSTAGAVVGWIHAPGNPGDNYVDFGLFREDGAVRDFMNGYEGSILLDFNVDGPIFEKIDTPRESVSWQNP
jgi:hypothetical protein